MIPAAAPQPVPLARVRLQRVPVRGFSSANAVPVFHVFEELARRAAEQPRQGAAARRPSTRA